MKKILLVIFMLFNFSFAGETGYVLLNNEIKGISSDKLLNIGTIIKIPKNTYFYKDIDVLNNINNKNNIEECFSTESYFCNKVDITVKILSYVKFNERIFILVSNTENIKPLNTEFFEKNIKKEISDYSLCLKGEDIIFSCETDNKKIISFCLNENKNALFYKYGTKNKDLELEYSSIPNQDINLFFEFAHDDYSKGKSEQLAFKKGKFVYTFFSESHVYNPSLAGIVVEKEDKKIVQINCNKKFIVDNLFDIYKYFKFNKSELRYMMEIEGE